MSKKHSFKYIAFSLTLLVLVSALSWLLSCGNKGALLDTVSVGKYTFEFYGEGDVISYFEIKDEKKTIGKFECNGQFPMFEDLNFDTIPDLRMDDLDNEGHYLCYVFQENVGKFTKNNILSGLLDPVWDYENEIIVAQVRSKVTIAYDPGLGGEETYKETRGEQIWKWQGGNPVQLTENGIEYFSDSQIFCVYSYKRVNGECVRDSTADKWYYSFEHLVSAGYTWDN